MAPTSMILAWRSDKTRLRSASVRCGCCNRPASRSICDRLAWRICSRSSMDMIRHTGSCVRCIQCGRLQMCWHNVPGTARRQNLRRWIVWAGRGTSGSLWIDQHPDQAVLCGTQCAAQSWRGLRERHAFDGDALAHVKVGYGAHRYRPIDDDAHIVARRSRCGNSRCPEATARTGCGGTVYPARNNANQATARGCRFHGKDGIPTIVSNVARHWYIIVRTMTRVGGSQRVCARRR